MDVLRRTGVVFPASDLGDVVRDGDSVTFSLPLEIVSEANRRDHWAVKAKRVKRQKRTAHIATLQHAGYLRCHIQAGEDIRLGVTLVRFMCPRQRHFDGDNLQSASKAVRDGIAAALDINDGSDRAEWCYAKERAEGKRGGVRVEITRFDF